MIYLKTSIGIEIGSADLTLASLQGNLSGETLSHFMHIPDFRNRDAAELRQDIQVFLKNNVLGKDAIVVGIPPGDVLLRQLDLPAEVMDNIKQVIQYQVQSFEPTEEDSYYYDYSFLGRSPKNRRVSILLVMVRKNVLDEYLQRLFDLGIQPAGVTCRSLALVNLFLHNRKNVQGKTHVLAHTASSRLELSILQNGIPVYTHEVAKGVNQSWKDLIMEETSDAASRIRLDAESSIESFILAGEDSEAALTELKETIGDCMLLKDAIAVKGNEQTAPYLQKAAGAIALAFTGLTRKHPVKINLIPAAFRFKQTRWAYATAAALGLIIIALLAGLLLHGRIQSRKMVEKLDNEIIQNKPKVDRVLELRTETEALANKIEYIEGLYRKQDRNLEVLEELTQILPSDTYLNSYVYRDGKVSIGGYSNSASDLILMLESSPLFKDVGQKGTTTRDQRTGKERFQIEATLEE
jgi:Tfp pilus assembly PilM family ATPase/Tfp pilus assembly protein PilN